MANHGTLFLDERGDMPLHLQAKLLRVLQGKTIERIGGLTTLSIDVRVIAATNKNLDEMIKINEFREDLYFRLNVIPIHISPLGERTCDIPPILDKSLERFNRILGKKITGFDTGMKHWKSRWITPKELLFQLVCERLEQQGRERDKLQHY